MDEDWLSSKLGKLGKEFSEDDEKDDEDKEDEEEDEEDEEEDDDERRATPQRLYNVFCFNGNGRGHKMVNERARRGVGESIVKKRV